MTWTPLSGEVWANTPDSVKAVRAARWLRVVAQLQADHYARYHAAQEARLVEWAQSRGAA
jgi:hypothetical protein